MDLKRVRLQLTCIYGVISALAIGAISWYAIDAGRDRIFESAERDLTQVVLDLALRWPDEGEGPANTWIINDEEDYAYELGETWVEPPLMTLVSSVGDGAGYNNFELDGTWLTYASPWTETEHVLTTLFFEDYEHDADSLRFRIVVAALTSILVAAVAGYWVAGRSLQPARRLVGQQRDFIADAAHELRTPLAIIQASASQTLSREREPEEYRAALSEIRTASERASVGVHELLDLARLEAGQANPRLAPLRADLLVEEVASAVRVDNVTITAKEGEALVADADYALLRQVVENMTRNAAARASEVTLGSHLEDRWAVITVTDNGPGFDPDVLPHVFDRFRRGDAKGSSGLGMAIAKSIVDAHHGSIAIENRDEGGARVVLRIPLTSR